MTDAAIAALSELDTCAGCGRPIHARTTYVPDGGLKYHPFCWERPAPAPPEPTTGWLLIKRDLYWRPDASGYTGLKRDAGRYDLEEAKAWCRDGRDGITRVHESQAPDIRASCYSDYAAEYANQELARLRQALEQIQASCRMVAPANEPWTHQRAADAYGARLQVVAAIAQKALQQ
jgi:hypothetical protein